MTTRLRLRDNAGRIFLDRWGWECRWFGVYVHRVAAPDPGLDLHDHPWPFVSFVLWGGYVDEVYPAREASRVAPDLDRWSTARGLPRRCRRWRWHRVPLTDAHRIVSVEPRTWTLVVRGCKSRPWGFYERSGWVHWQSYDYAARRPCNETRETRR